MINQKMIFNYPREFVTLPEYSARRGQEVIVLDVLIDGKDYDREGGESMFRIKASDGWIGFAWISELDFIKECI